MHQLRLVLLFLKRLSQGDYMNYENLNDYELLSYVSESDDASEIIFEKYKPLIINVANKMYKVKHRKLWLNMLLVISILTDCETHHLFGKGSVSPRRRKRN